MAGWTNRCKYLVMNYYFRRQGTLPTNFYVALVTSAVAPGPDTNVLGDLTEIAAGNGYSAGGYQLTPNTTDFDTLTEDDANDLVALLVKNVSWMPSGGSIPASGNGARYAVLTTDEGTVSARQVLLAWSLTSDRTVQVGIPLTLVDLQANVEE